MTAHADQLYSRMSYMVTVNKLLADARKPNGQMGVLSERELYVQERFYTAGKSPEAFARHVRARRCKWCASRMPGYRRHTGFCSDMCALERFGAAHKEDV